MNKDKIKKILVNEKTKRISLINKDGDILCGFSIIDMEIGETYICYNTKADQIEDAENDN